MRDYLQKKQKLTLVWFFGRGGTHRLQVAWIPLFAAMISGIILILFSIFSAVYLLVISQHRNKLRAEMISLKENLFTMQVRHEQLFDRVYLDNNDHDKFREDQHPDLLSYLEEDVEVAELRQHTSDFTDQQALMATNAKGLSSELSATGKRWQLEGLQVKLADSGQHQLHVDYRVTHHKDNDRSTGYVWGIVAVQNQNSSVDQVSYVSVPDGKLVAKNTGDIRDHTLGDRFYIRRFRDHRFTFDLPPETKPVWIKLQVADVEGVIDAEWKEVLKEPAGERRAYMPRSETDSGQG